LPCLWYSLAGGTVVGGLLRDHVVVAGLAISFGWVVGTGWLIASVVLRAEDRHVAIAVADMPIKCPVAPLEFCFLADWYFTERGIRDQVQITYATPLDAAFTKSYNQNLWMADLSSGAAYLPRCP
jgi:hypothetical protein